MATVETVKIVFDVDSKELTDTTKELVSLGKVVDDDVAKFKKLNTEASNSDKAFTSLRTQVKQAKDEVARLSEEFGEFSAEANAARTKAGQLADQMSDLNRQVNLLNPEAKARAFVNFGQGVVGAFQVATGALQAFGAENEEVQKIAQKLQGALNVVQGIASIKALKESYQDIKVVLGVTTAAQNVLTTATTAGGVAATGAATATRGFTAALLANPFTAIAVAIGAVAGAFFLLKDNTEDSTDAIKENAQAQADARKQFEDTNKSLDDRLFKLNQELAVLRGEYTPLQAKINTLERERRKELEKTFDIVTKTKINDVYDRAIQLAREQNKENVKAIPTRDRTIVQATELRDLTQATADLTAQINTELDGVAPKYGKSARSIEVVNKELFDKVDRETKERAELAETLARESFDFIFELSAQSREREIADLEAQKEQGLITEEQYQEKLKALKIKQAKANKEAAIFQATTDFALALINALTFKPANAVPAALIATTAIAGLNLAKVIATPLPKFKEGTLNFQGGNIDGDGGALAVLHPNEAVIPADRNRAYHPTLEAIYKKQIKPSELNAFVLNRLAGKGGIGRDTQITASVDTYALSRAMSRNKGVEVTNAQMIGAAVASELSKRINPRQVL